MVKVAENIKGDSTKPWNSDDDSLINEITTHLYIDFINVNRHVKVFL